MMRTTPQTLWQKQIPTQCSAKLDSNTHNINVISPQIIKPKPRRIINEQTGELCRHCTETDLSKMMSTNAVSNDHIVRPNTPMTPFIRDAIGGSAPMLAHVSRSSDGSPAKLSLSPF